VRKQFNPPLADKLAADRPQQNRNTNHTKKENQNEKGNYNLLSMCGCVWPVELGIG
jgi:hypothetical protein